MNINYDSFIGIYNNVYPEGFCEHLISQFDLMERDGAGLTPVSYTHLRAHETLS
jgi:hypothetical protein